MTLFLYRNFRVPVIFVVLLSSLLLSLRPNVSCHHGQVAPLTYYNLVKVVKKFPAVLVNFDEKYPMIMKKKNEYTEFADEVRLTDNLLVGKLDVPFQGQDIDDENSVEWDKREEYHLAKKLNATDRDKYPILFFFVNHDMDNPIRFEPEPFNQNTIKDFVRHHSPPQVKFLCSNCIEELDDLAVDFVRAKTDKGKRKDILRKVQKLSKDKYANAKVKDNVQVYTKLMERILERGDIYIESENERVKNLLKSSHLTDNKRQNLQSHLNILDTFRWATTAGSSKSMANEKQEL